MSECFNVLIYKFYKFYICAGVNYPYFRALLPEVSNSIWLPSTALPRLFHHMEFC